MVHNPRFTNFDPDESQTNLLLEYLQEQHPEVLEQVAQSATPEVRQIISQNVKGLVGMLDTDDFEVQITTNRENMVNLLASAMMTGYFLRRMEQRMELDETLEDSNSFNY